MKKKQSKKIKLLDATLSIKPNIKNWLYLLPIGGIGIAAVSAISKWIKNPEKTAENANEIVNRFKNAEEAIHATYENTAKLITNTYIFYILIGVIIAIGITIMIMLIGCLNKIAKLNAEIARIQGALSINNATEKKSP